MAIRFHIAYKDSAKEDTWIPVAGHSTFKEYWEPGITKFNLRWLELMGSAGLPILIHMDELPEIVNELIKLKEYFSDENLSISDPVRFSIVEKLNEVLWNIEYIQGNVNDVASAYLG